MGLFFQSHNCKKLLGDAQKEITTTSDGSVTIYLPQYKEYYHSIHGAWQESMHVYIKNGLGQKPLLHELEILEMGFGTGLNAFLTWEYALQNNVNVKYTTLEAFPLAEGYWSQLNYHKYSEMEGAEQRMMVLHNSEWERWVQFSPYFRLLKKCLHIEEWVLQDDYNVIFYDAFAPRVQPELWTVEIFRKLFSHIKPGGVLVTYSASGETKRNLSAAGFTVTSPAGPPGKREMTKALKPG